ncbi:MAG: asparagine synthase (glutamine-hydrolyzing) [Bacteroidales bacterium]|nr:asparagine synthase (glutamine-hydrolyzing) [Bacteroidales bacterium]
MCGITGYINLGSKPIKDSSQILSMLDVQKHRGPDDSGIMAFSLKSGESAELEIREPGPVKDNLEGVLGFNRLSILDLSFNGHQPMVSPDKKVLLTLNGEIYNAFDYKNELEDWGYVFKSTTDTEIVLALYLRYGFEGMLSRLNGMFAIVIADLGINEIFITRDRFGIKPMYYILTDDIFAFSSELKSFRYIDGFNFQLAEEQLDEFLLFRNNLKGTLFRDIQSLDPGYYIAFSHRKGLVSKHYFNLNTYSRVNDLSVDIGTYGNKLEGWLNKSVKSQLMSDVKLGCQLSGGIDSSIVTWLANRNSDKGKFESVSIVFNDQRFNEEKFINRVKDTLRITSHKFLLDSDYYLDNIERATWHLEAPLNHPNTVAIYKLSQRAKEYVTVLLSGEGADEVFGGYDRFYNLSYPFRGRKLLHEIKKNIKHPIRLKDYFDHKYRAVMATAFMTPFLAGNLMSNFDEHRAIAGRRSLYESLNGSLFDRQVKYEMHSYLPDLLIRQDKMSMAHSIENRVPFLDNEVVENSFTIPEKYLLLRKSPEGYNTEKYLLKKMTAETFGFDFAFRDKMGFGIPLKEFFLKKEFADYLNNKILPGTRERGLFNHQLATGWLSNIQLLKYYELEALWVIVSFEIWASLYLDT